MTVSTDGIQALGGSATATGNAEISANGGSVTISPEGVITAHGGSVQVRLHQVAHQQQTSVGPVEMTDGYESDEEKRVFIADEIDESEEVSSSPSPRVLAWL